MGRKGQPTGGVVIEPFREVRQDGSLWVRQEVLHIGAPSFVQQLGDIGLGVMWGASPDVKREQRHRVSTAPMSASAESSSPR